MFNPFVGNALLHVYDDFEQWIAVRRGGFSGTDAYKLLKGETEKLAEEKLTGSYIPQTLPMRIGLALEPVVREFAEKDLGEKIYSNKTAIFRHSKMTYLLGSLDGWTKSGLVLEFKTSVTKGYWPSDGIPENYYAQVQHYLLVTGAQQAILYALVLTGDEVTPKRFVIERDEDLIEEIVTRATAMNAFLFEKGIVDLPQFEPYKIRVKTNGVEMGEKTAVETMTGDPVQADVKIETLLREYEEVAQIEKHAAAKREELAKELKAKLLGEYGRPILDSKGMIWRVDKVKTPVYNVPNSIKERYLSGYREYEKLTIVKPKAKNSGR